MACVLCSSSSWLLAVLAVTAVSCAASWSSSQSSAERSAVSRRIEFGQAAEEHGRTVYEETLREEVVTTCAYVPAESVAAEVALAVLDSLPEGARFVVREGRLELSAERRGDKLLLGARSDSLARRTEHRSRTVAVRHCDTVRRCTAQHGVVAADTLRSSSAVAEAERSRPRGGGWWRFAAGFGLCVVLLALLRR